MSAGNQKRRMSCLIAVQVHVVVVVLLYNHLDAKSIARAQTPLVESICKQAESYEFCCSTFSSHLRTATADLDGLALISIAKTIEQVRDTRDRLMQRPELLVSSHGHISVAEKQRFKVCQSDYRDALDNFLAAFASSSRRSYWEVIDWVKDGANKAIDCEDVYRRHLPISVSPITADNHKVVKLVEMTLIAVQSLLT